MLLAFDIGNSQTKIGLFEQSQMISSGAFDTNAKHYAATCRQVIQKILTDKNLQPAQITGVVIASVVPVCTKQAERLSHSFLKQKPLVVSARLKTALTIKYRKPLKLGGDRLCNAVAAYHTCKDAVIVVDWGTTTKFEVIDKKGNYLGGAIAPGLGVSTNILKEKTAQLPIVQLKFPRTVIGNDTEHCIQSGILFGAIEMTMGMITRFKNELDGKPKVIATGGFADLLKSHLHGIDRYEPNLVLEGARLIYEEGC